MQNEELTIIGYLGPQGTFTEVAMKKYVQGRPHRAFPFSNIAEVLWAIQEEKVEVGIVPMENTIEGTVNITLDTLVHDVDLHIIGEIIIPVQHTFMGQAQNLNEIKRVYSHPHALAQCRTFLQEQLPWAVVESCSSTAEGARLAALAGPEAAAIGTTLAAQMYGLRIIAEGIQDVTGNHTRFVVLNKKPVGPSGDDKTSLVFSLDKDRPGGLYEILGEFAHRQINLTKIESRPAKSSLGEYLFFIDCQGHREDPLVKEALKALEVCTSFLKIMGSYPRDKGGV